MLPLPNPLPPLEHIFLRSGDTWVLTRRARTELGCIFQEVGLQIEDARSPVQFQEMMREVLSRRRQLHLSEAYTEKLSPEEHVLLDIFALGDLQKIQEAVKQDARQFEVAARRKSLRLV